MPACSAGCVRSIVALSASVSRESASKVRPACVKKSDCSIRQRGHHPRRVGELGEEPPEARLAVRERAHDRREVAEHARQLLDGGVEIRAAARQRRAEAVEGTLDPAAGGRVVDPCHVVEVHGPDRLLDREDMVLLRRLARLAARHLEVLQAQRRARPDREHAVHRDLALVRLEHGVDLGRRPAVLERARAHLAHEADPDPALTHLGAATDRGRVVRQHLHLEVGHERQPLVRVVGEEDGDERDEHGDGPDQDRAGHDRCGRAAAHGASR